MEWAIFDRVNPATSSAWHFLHWFWSIEIAGTPASGFAAV
jgi:hypothetical protein